MGIFNHLKDFLSRPFQEDMDVWNWILFLGFIIIAVFLWTRILKHIEPIGEAIS